MDTDAYRQLLDDLQLECRLLATQLRELPPEQWRLNTPAEGWTIHDQITHLAYFDEATTMALRHPADFRSFADGLMQIYRCGIHIIGGCCGSDPDCMQAVYRELFR